MKRKKKIYYYYYNSQGGVQGEYDVFWILGDSISRGASNPEVAGPTPEAGTVYEWNGSSLVQITDADLADAIGGSIFPQHGIDYNTNTGRKVIYVNCGIGGSTITPTDASEKWWSETGEGSLWQDALDKLDGVLSVPGGARFAGVIISGGVNDFRQAVKPTAAEFKTDLQDLINRVITQVGSSVPIHLFQVVSAGTSESRLASEMRNKVMEIVEENVNVHLSINTLAYDAHGYVSADEVHFSQTGNNIAGKQLARYQNYGSTYSKRIKSILSTFETELTSEEETLWVTFLESCIANGNIDALDSVQVYVSSSETNSQIDIAGITIRGIDAATFNADANLATNGSSTYVYSGFKPATNARYSSQEDLIVGTKTGTWGESAGTTRYLFGAFTTSGVTVFQNSSGINYRVNDATAGFWNGETQFASNTVYAVGRNGGTRFLMKNKTQAHSASVASSAATGRSIALGCRANGSSSFDNFAITEVEYFFAAKWTTLDYDSLIDDLNSLTTGLKAL